MLRSKPKKFLLTITVKTNQKFSKVSDLTFKEQEGGFSNTLKAGFPNTLQVFSKTSS